MVEEKKNQEIILTNSFGEEFVLEEYHDDNNKK